MTVVITVSTTPYTNKNIIKALHYIFGQEYKLGMPAPAEIE
jgi:hypothetical protein